MMEKHYPSSNAGWHEVIEESSEEAATSIHAFQGPSGNPWREM